MVDGIPPTHIFLVVTVKVIENYIIKISEGNCNFNEKNNYASNFDKKTFSYDIKSLEERKLIFIENLSFYSLTFFICRKCDTSNVNSYLPTKKRFL